ncbi:MAG: phenylalanine--tRNA ligase subunit beta [Candidatus Omnitrophota bacterium]
MKLTYNWLKDFVEIKISPQALADKLTMAGLEVTSLEERGGDFVFEIEITSNRPDCLSVIGIAREVAAITGKKLREARGPQPKVQRKNKKVCGLSNIDYRPFSINIEDKADCPLYTAKIIKGVKIAPSPDWLRARLELIGKRCVNNIVDITNYILFAFGEPLHAFDLDKLSWERISIRRAKKEEKIVAIDGTEKSLDPGILVIADKNLPIAIAGIMGGKAVEVTLDTKNILLEAAVFNPLLTRRARRKLGMQTDSSYRFERGVDPETAISASWQAVKLIQELTGGKIALAKASGVTKTKSRSVDLSASSAAKLLGIEIAPARVKRILSDLGFKPKAKSKNKFSVIVPEYRQDVALEQDLIEEIARIYGYESIAKTLPLFKPCISEEKTIGQVSLVKNTLVGLGLNEAITYSLIDRNLLSGFSMRDFGKPIEILNPKSQEQEILRPTAIPSLCARVAYNLNQKQEYINLFEISRAFLNSSSVPAEELLLSIALCGVKSYALSRGIIREEAGLLNLKGITEALFENLGIKDFDFKGESGYVGIYVKKEKIGIMLQLEKSALEALDIKNKDVFVLEASLDRVFSASQLKKSFSLLPKYPGIYRDISFIIKESATIKEILRAMKEKGGLLLVEAKVGDYYKGKQIPAGFRGLTVSCLYRSDERTLTEPEINPLHAAVSNVLTGLFGAKIR